MARAPSNRVSSGPAEDAHRTGRGAQKIEAEADGRRLARPVGTQVTEDLSPPDLEIEPVDRGQRAEALGQLPGLDHHLGLLAHAR
jgi:hypothetical protein